MSLKSKILFSIAAALIVLCQVGISYLSFSYIMEGELVLGFSLFLVVPVLALVVVYGIIVCRKGHSGDKPE